MMLTTKPILLALTALLALTTTSSAFVSPSSSSSRLSQPAVLSRSSQPVGSTSTTALSERRWNFNSGQAPWGLKKNAEIWNGRVAQMAFTLVFIQELIQGKGVVQGFQDGDPVNTAVAGGFGVSVLALTAWLAIKGEDDYTKPGRDWD